MLSLKKKEERWFLDEFLKVLHPSSSRVIEGSDSQFPDFFVEIAGGWTAVELTKFQSFEGAVTVSARQREAEWERISSQIDEIREQTGRCQNMNVLLNFGDGGSLLPSKKQTSGFIADLLSLIEAKGNSCDEFQRFSDFKNSTHLKGFLSAVHIQKTNCFVSWGSDCTAGFVGLNEIDLLKIVESKLVMSGVSTTDLKLRALSAGVQLPSNISIAKNWLLIYTTFYTSQSIGQLWPNSLVGFDDLNQKLSAGPYDKVFLFDVMYKQGAAWEDAKWTLVNLKEELFHA